MFKKEKKLTIVSALEHIYTESKGCKLEKEYFEKCAEEFAYLRQNLGLTDIQLLFLSVVANKGGASGEEIGDHLNITNLRFMVMKSAVDELRAKQWIISAGRKYSLAHGVLETLADNKVFTPINYRNLEERQFLGLLASYKTKYSYDEIDDKTLRVAWMNLLESNKDIPICRKTLELQTPEEQIVFLALVVDYFQYGLEGAGMKEYVIGKHLGKDFFTILRSDPIVAKGFIEEKIQDGMAKIGVYVVSTQIVDTYLGKYDKRTTSCKGYRDIPAKQLFYNDSESSSIERLVRLLEQDRLTDVFNRLGECGMRKGIACLFYGAPGTGKTETVLQIARQSGRDLVELDISNIRNKYVGETEKSIKRVFTSYRDLCHNSNVTPILFVNEADAIFCRRSENTSRAVDKMENSMQNIILQEMERLEGILIATTNLTGNFDSAFERRFLFKIEFHKPELEVRSRIWESMLKDYSRDICTELAKQYDFSGGQIENISRKSTIDYVLTGQHPSVDKIKQFCREEMFGREAKRIGFNTL